MESSRGPPMMGMLAKSSTGKGSYTVAGVVTKTRQAAASVRNMNSPKSNAGRLASPACLMCTPP